MLWLWCITIISFQNENFFNEYIMIFWLKRNFFFLQVSTNKFDLKILIFVCVTWLILPSICADEIGTWAIDNDVVPSVFSCWVTICCGWLSLAWLVSTIVCWVWFDATVTAIVCCCSTVCCCWTCCWAVCDVDGISSGSFLTCTVWTLAILLLFVPV